MGCGASSAHHVDFGLEEEAAPPKADQKDSNKKQATGNGRRSADDASTETDMVVRAVSKNRMESRYPWEMDGRQLPEDVTIIFILGPPGSGKSTQCQRLVQRYGATHLSSGDLLRAEVQAGTALGKWVNDLMQQGSLVPFQVTLTLLKKAMLASSSPVMLIDGFPRAMEQLSLFEKTISPAHAIVFLDVPLEVAVARASGRARADDNEASIQQQWQIFTEQTAAVRTHFVEKKRAVVVDGTGSQEEVFQNLAEVYKAVEDAREVELNELQAQARAAHAATNGAGGGVHGGQQRSNGDEEEEEEENSSY